MLRCRYCNAEYRAGDLNLTLALAHCHACKGVDDLSGQSVQLPGMIKPVLLNSREHPRPDGFTVQEGPGSLKISWRWPTRHGVIGAVVALATVAIGVKFMEGGLSDFWTNLPLGLGAVEVPGLARLLIYIPLAVAALLLCARSLAFLLNTTTVEVQGDALRVSTWPIRFPVAKDVTLAAGSVDQIYVERKMRPDPDDEDPPSYHYNLKAKLKDRGRIVTLFKDLNGVEEGLWLEQKLEEALRIEDRPVSGELVGRPRQEGT